MPDTTISTKLFPYSTAMGPGWRWNCTGRPSLGTPPQGLQSFAKDRYKLVKVRIILTKITNNNAAIVYLNGALVSRRGNTKSTSPINVRLQVGSYMSTNTITINNKLELIKTRSDIPGYKGQDVYTQYCSYAPITEGNIDNYICDFNFNQVPITQSMVKSQCYLIITGGDYNGSTSGNSANRYGVATGGSESNYLGWDRCFWEVIDTYEPPPPTPVHPIDADRIITDLSGAPRSVPGVKKDFTATYDYPYPSWDAVTGTDVSGDVHVNVSVSDPTITITAKDDQTDYPISDSITITYTGYDIGHGTDAEGNPTTYEIPRSAAITFNVSFYEKIRRYDNIQYEEDNVENPSGKGIVPEFNMLARDVEYYNIGIRGYGYFTDEAKAHNTFKYTDKQDVGIFTIDNDISIPLGQFFNYEKSDTQNIHKIADDAKLIDYKFRFYNSEVQEKTSDGGTYKKDLDTKIRIYMAPNDASQIGFDFLDRNNNVISGANLPGIILMQQEDVMIGNITYPNDSIEGGYCRGFRFTFRGVGGGSEYLSFDLDSNNNMTGSYNGKIMELGSGLYNSLPYNVVMELVVEPYFKFGPFGSLFGSAYSDCSVVIGPLFLKIKDEDLVPKLIFPVLSNSAPYTPMMLPDVERFGYEFTDVIWQNWNYFKSRFGINIDGIDMYVDTVEGSEYYTSKTVVKHIIFNMGSFIVNYSIFKEDVYIRPFIDTLYDTPQEKRIYAPQNESHLCTTKDSTWRRPIANKGEFLRYFDAERFMQFINKYKPLNNNQIWSVPIEMRGYIIDTDFWIQKANYLNSNYVDSMIAWLNESSVIDNDMPCWVHTEFLHKKGEYLFITESAATHDYLYEMGFTHDYLSQFTHDQIAKIATVNNLKQNYYDLLIGMSAYLKKATYDYLRYMKYTHNFLHGFTHDQITNREGGI